MNSGWMCAGGRPDLLECVGEHAEARRAKIGAMRVAEIDQQPLAREIRAAHDATLGVLECQGAAEA